MSICFQTGVNTRGFIGKQLKCHSKYQGMKSGNRCPCQVTCQKA